VTARVLVLSLLHFAVHNLLSLFAWVVAAALLVLVLPAIIIVASATALATAAAASTASTVTFLPLVAALVTLSNLLDFLLGASYSIRILFALLMASTASAAFSTTATTAFPLLSIFLTRFTWLSRFTVLLRLIRLSRSRIIVVSRWLLLLGVVSYSSVGSVRGLCTQENILFRLLNNLMLLIMRLGLCTRELLGTTCELNARRCLHLTQILVLLSLLVHAPPLVIVLALVLVVALGTAVGIVTVASLRLLLALLILLLPLMLHHLVVSSSFSVCVLHEYTLWLNVEDSELDAPFEDVRRLFGDFLEA